MNLLGVYPATARTIFDPAARMIEVYSAHVNHEEGGAWELTLTMSAHDLDALDCLADQCIFAAPTPEGMQPFRLRYVERDGDIVTVRAPHVYFDADGVLIYKAVLEKLGDQDRTIWDAIDVLRRQTYTVYSPTPAQNPNPDPQNPNGLPWTLITDGTVTTRSTFRFQLFSLTEAMELVAERWSCYIKPSGFGVVLTGNRGSQTGYAIRYGVNMTRATVSYDWSTVATAIFPTGENEAYYYPPSHAIPFPQYAIAHLYHREYQTGITREMVREEYPEATDEQIERIMRNLIALEAANMADIDVDTHSTPSVNYTVEGYVDANTHIRTGDTVRCVDPRYDLDLTAACIAYDYNVITETYDSIQFGDFQRSLRSLRPKN